MNQSRRKTLADKYGHVLLMILLFIGFNGYGQTYNPSAHVVVNDAISPAQANPVDSRSMFFDATNFVYRPYQSTSEVKSYLNLSKYRVGNFLIVVDSGGILQPGGFFTGGVNNFWMFKDGTADGNLVELNLTGASGCVGCLLAANNLSDLSNAGLARSNLGLGTMATQSTTASSTDLSGTWPSGLTVNSVQGANLANLRNYLNLTNTPAIPAQLNPTALGQMVITGTYPNLSFNSVLPGFEQTLLKSNTTSQPDSIIIGANIFSIFGTSALGVPTGTTAQRPSSPSFGYTRANTDSTNSPLETWNGTAWVHPTGGGGGGGSGITQLTGDGTAGPGSGSQVFTLATVNSNLFPSNTFLKFGVNGKGLVISATAVGSGDITGALGFTPYNATNPSGYIPLTALSATTPLQYNNATGVFSILQAGTSQIGYLSSTDWNTFNGKLNNGLPSGNIFVGNASNIATGQTMTGDVGINNTGVATIQTNAVTTSKINANAVTYGKIQLATQQALLGAPAAGAYQEITLGTNLSITGGVLNASTAGAQTLTYTQNATNNNLAISGGNSVNFLIATATKAGLVDSAHYHFLDSLYLGLKVFNIYAGNLMTASGNDTLNAGGTALNNTTFAMGSFSLSITGLPNKTVGGTDSALIENIGGQLFKAPFPTSGINQLTGDVTAGPGTGSQVATIAALAVTTGKLAANAVTLGKMSTGPSNQLIGYDGSGNPTNISGGTGITISSGVISSTGAGGGTLTPNALGDSVGVNGVQMLRWQNYTNINNNEAYWFNMTSSLPKSKFAAIRDTFSITSDSTHLNIAIGPGCHSFGDRSELYQKNFVDYLLPKFQFAGPGFFGGDMTNYGFSPVVGWTLRTFFTSPQGRGVDGKSLISGSSDITISTGAAASSYNSYQDIIVFTYDTTTGGTFTLSADASVVATINTSVGTGYTATKVHLSANSKHTLVFHETAAATTHCELIGVYLYTSNIRGVIVNKMAQGSTDVTNWFAEPTLAAMQTLAAINPDLIISDLQVNNQNHNIDTNTARIDQDTLIGRWRAYVPNVAIVLMKGTDYSFARYGTPLYPRVAFARQLDQLVRKDTVASFDNNLIVGPFPRSLSGGIATLTGDSLHPSSQTMYTIVGDLLSNIGGMSLDVGIIQPNILSQDSSNQINSSSIVAWNLNNKSLHINSLSSLNIGDGTHIMTITPNSTFGFSGAAVGYNFDNNLSLNSGFSFSVLGTAVSRFGRLTVGASSSGNALDVIDPTGGTTNVKFTSSGASGATDVILGNNSATANNIVYEGTTGSLGGNYTASSLTFEQGASAPLNIMNQTNNPIQFITGANSTANIRAQFTGGGNLLLRTTTDSSAFLHIGAGSATVAPLKLTAGAVLTTPINGAIEFDGVNYYGTAGGTRTAFGGGVNFYTTDGTLTSNRSVSGSSGSFDLNLGTPGTSTTYLNNFRVSAATSILIQSSANLRLSGGLQYQNGSLATDAAYSVTTTDMIIDLPVITANRVITLPSTSGMQGRYLIFVNRNTSGNTWQFSPAIQDAAGNSITNLVNGTTYQVIVDPDGGSNVWLKIN